MTPEIARIDTETKPVDGFPKESQEVYHNVVMPVVVTFVVFHPITTSAAPPWIHLRTTLETGDAVQVETIIATAAATATIVKPTTVPHREIEMTVNAILVTNAVHAHRENELARLRRTHKATPLVGDRLQAFQMPQFAQDQLLANALAPPVTSFTLDGAPPS
jgi:hypothetical protein